MLEIKSIVHSYKIKKKISRDLYGNRDKVALLLGEFNKVYNKSIAEQKKNVMISRLQFLYRSAKLELLKNQQYPLPSALNSKLLERLEDLTIQSFEDCISCLHLILEINYEKIKLHGSGTSRSFVPLSQSSICLADCVCLTGFILLGLATFEGIVLSIYSLT
ncbi:homoserine dehydrogenase [Bacillus clarus]|uniref:Homoserine dehydrogenase n=1 Tax=Bacillus clarus TaxID=2338372 RepID=A0A090YVW7_9BACI|nr:homoserine dehydrogenase [Bacillus clarus]KFN03014.1 hypothetical protein DJ93_4778 [Bacillus clarus]RFT67559.1 homoserine dehydrogenase [Bacillus clarus]